MAQLSRKIRNAAAFLACAALLHAGSKKATAPQPPRPAVELYSPAPGAVVEPTPGSLYTPGSILGDVARDTRAHQVNDLITILVADKASAVTKGASQSSRASSAKASINSVFGSLPTGSALANLAGMSGNTSLQGQGTTSRESSLSTTVSARVVGVLSNGNLVIEGGKSIQVNSDSQKVVVRGVVRPMDLSPTNQVASDQIADLEVRINGKGLVSSAVRQPNILYRLFLGLLPF